MIKTIGAVLVGAFALSLAACGGGSSGGGSGLPAMSPGGGNPPAGVGPMTIGVALPDGTIGTVSTSFGVVGGYTQSIYSQTLAFAPGTTITIKNLSTVAHTLNVLSTSGFPTNPVLSSTAAGGNTLAAGFQSGTLAANGGSVSVTLSTPGTYYIGCAFHYNDPVSMRDVIQVSASATPGPQATPQPSSGGNPSPGGGNPPPGGGYGY